MGSFEERRYDALEAFQAMNLVYGKIDNGNEKAPSIYYFPRSSVKARSELRVVKFRKATNEGGNPELSILRRLSSHPNVQKVIDAETSAARIWFASAATSTLSLFSYVEQYASNQLVPEAFIWHIFRQATSVLAFMHSGVTDDHRRGHVMPASHAPISHNAFYGENLMLVPASGRSSGYPDLMVTEFSEAKRHAYKPTESAKTNKHCKYDLSNLSVVLHYVMHRQTYGAQKDPESDSYCVCFKRKEDQATPLKPYRYTSELMGILNAIADPRDKYQFTAADLLAHLDPTFTARKLRHSPPLPVGLDLALAPEVEGTEVSVVEALKASQDLTSEDDGSVREDDLMDYEIHQDSGEGTEVDDDGFHNAYGLTADEDIVMTDAITDLDRVSKTDDLMSGDDDEGDDDGEVDGVEDEEDYEEYSEEDYEEDETDADSDEEDEDDSSNYEP